MPSEETQVRERPHFYHNTLSRSWSQERIIKAVEISRVSVMCPSNFPSTLAHAYILLLDYIPLWLDSSHYLCWIYGESAPALTDSVCPSSGKERGLIDIAHSDRLISPLA